MSKTIKKSGLGKGLTSLLGEDYAVDVKEKEQDLQNSNFIMLPLSKIEPNPNQPRKNFDKEALNELADSIKTHGVIAPITVRSTNDYYQIIAGERRWRAARAAGLKEMPAYILDADDKVVMELALVENLQRQDLNPMEESMGYDTLMKEYGLTQDEVAERVGKSRSAVANSLRLLSLNSEVAKMLEEGKLSGGHARAVLSVKDREKQTMAAHIIVEKNLSVRQAESLAKRLNKPESKEETDIEVNYLREIEKELEASLGRKISIVTGKNKGTIELEYYGNDDLERLTQALKTINV